MNIRRLIVIALVVAMFVAYYYMAGGKGPSIIKMPDNLKVEQIKSEFIDYKQNPKSGISNENLTVLYLYFSPEFNGSKGDVFYLGTEIKDSPVIMEYGIENINEQDASSNLIYKLKSRWNNLQLPEGRFETYQLKDGKWLVLNPKK